MLGLPAPIDASPDSCQRLVMCGRFTQMYTWEELHALYDFRGQQRLNLEPRYNISPTTNIDIVLPADEGHKLERARCSLVPIWWKKELKDEKSMRKRLARSKAGNAEQPRR